MNLAQVIQQETVSVGETLATKGDVLRRVAELARESSVLEGVSVEEILTALSEREQVGTTGFGDGIAIPHCRLGGISGFVTGVLTLAKGVDFDSTDGRPVRIVAFIVGPESDPTRHLKLLSALSLALSSRPARADLLAADTPDRAIQALGRSETAAQVPDKTPARRLFQVVVQDESLFLTLLEVFEGTGGAAVSVLEGGNTSTYLSRLPLFASLLSDSPREFNRMILATVPADLSNETVRRIESVTGSLDDRSDVLLIVQDVHYAAGGLSV